MSLRFEQHLAHPNPSIFRQLLSILIPNRLLSFKPVTQSRSFAFSPPPRAPIDLRLPSFDRDCLRVLVKPLRLEIRLEEGYWSVLSYSSGLCSCPIACRVSSPRRARQTVRKTACLKALHSAHRTVYTVYPPARHALRYPLSCETLPPPTLLPSIIFFTSPNLVLSLLAGHHSTRLFAAHLYIPFVLRSAHRRRRCHRPACLLEHRVQPQVHPPHSIFYSASSRPIFTFLISFDSPLSCASNGAYCGGIQSVLKLPPAFEVFMPATDAADQADAREYEQMLRYYVYSGRAPQDKLDWFLALPKRVRRSRRLIGEALGPYDEAREREQEDQERRMAAELEETLRLAAIRACPRDLSCLTRGEAAWGGVGRRKKRCRAFRIIGKAYIRQLPPAVASLAPVFALDVPVSPSNDSSTSSPESTPPSSPRPATPDGLREAAFSCVGLLASSAGVNGYGQNTPRPLPQPPTQVLRRPPSPIPPPEPRLEYEGETIIDGQPVDCRLASLMAMGCWEGCKWRSPPSLRRTAQSILDTDALQPGMIDCLISIFFPQGLDDWSLARPRLVYLKDFVLGWYALAPDS